LLAGAGAWVSMFFGIASVVFFLEITGLAQDEFSGGVAFVLIALMAGAAAIEGARRERRSSAFFDQAVLSLSLAAQGLIYAGLLLMTESAVVAACALVPTSAYLYKQIPGFANRGLSALIALGAVAFALESIADGDIALCSMYVALVALVTAVYAPGVLSARQRALLKPLAGVSALFVAIGSTSIASEIIDLPVVEIQTAALVVACGVLAALIYLESDGDEASTARLGVVAAALVVLGLITEPGVLCAVWLLAIAVWHGRTRLLVLGVVALGAHLTVYYYHLDTTLLAKSGSLVGASLVLLALRWWLERDFDDASSGGEA
ncbi:MAG: DUF4401 domain-containing protein, partial [Persicimonas sp.]